jgi:hypothetical protein
MPTNHPRVKLSRLNRDNAYDVILDMTIPYALVLVERLARLKNFTNNNTLEQATQLINQAGVACTMSEVDKVLFGEGKGMIPSTIASIEGRNTNRPANYSGKLARQDGTPYFLDSEGRHFVRGVIVDGHYPLKTPTNTFTAIRNCLEVNLNLPRYIRHQLTEFDETVDRDENNNPR